MARLWQEREGVAPPVLMIDSSPQLSGPQWHPLESFVYDLLRTAGHDMPDLPPDLLALPPEQALRRVLDLVPRSSGLHGIGVPALAGHYRVFLDIGEAYRGHQPQRYDGPVHLVRPDESESVADLWRPLCGELVESTAPGDHYTVLRRSATDLAVVIGRILAQVESRVAG
jgi:hypothetical protein